MSNLIVNPYSIITKLIAEDGNLVGVEIESPVPSKAKKFFRILTEANPELVEYLVDLTKWGFAQFNSQDLSETERQILIESGFIVDENSTPQRPLFHSFVDEIKLDDSLNLQNFDDFIVNPSFRLDPFDLTKAATQIQENNFSPYFPIGWISLPVSEIAIPFWFRNEDIEIAQKLKAGEKLDFSIGENTLRKLTTAGIVTTSDNLLELENKAKDTLEKAHQKYIKDKYVVLEEILPNFYMQAMKKFFREYVANGFMPFNDTQVKRRFYQHNLPLAQFFHQNFVKLMSQIVGLEVKPSYVYAASYIEEAALDPHIDREQCEYSISFQVDYQPEPIDDISPWGLYLSPFDENCDQSLIAFPWEDYPEDNSTNKQFSKVNLKSGDGLFYKGRELVHYRYPLAKGHKSTSLFFHYVAKNFAGVLN